MKVKIATTDEIKALSDQSVSLGNIPLYPGHSLASMLLDGDEVVGFTAVQSAWHTAGSWVKDSYRLKGYSRILRSCLEEALRNRFVPFYFSLPGNDLERSLFAKYGPVTERIAQVKAL